MHNLPAYPTDLTDEQWHHIESRVPQWNGIGRPPTHSRRQILNALLYHLRSGGAWRLLPHDFPAWQTVYDYFRQWQQHGRWDQLHDRLRQEVRQHAGKQSQPTAAILDSQSVKVADQPGVRGYDAGKKIAGRKRHLVVDTLGLILAVVVTAASVQDRDGARRVLAVLAHRFSRVVSVWADGGYTGTLVAWLWSVRAQRRVRLAIVNRLAGQRGFAVLPKRWIVERTFAWLVKYRRLRCDYERVPATSETLIKVAMIHLMLRRLA
ncbi:MAG: IS5 family transposase [Burkholderiales bacterium]